MPVVFVVGADVRFQVGGKASDWMRSLFASFENSPGRNRKGIRAGQEIALKRLARIVGVATDQVNHRLNICPPAWVATVSAFLTVGLCPAEPAQLRWAIHGGYLDSLRPAPERAPA
jgi:hypothetical protein